MVYEIETNIFRVLHILSTCASGRAQRPSRLDHHIALLVYVPNAIMMFHSVLSSCGRMYRPSDAISKEQYRKRTAYPFTVT